MSKRFTRWADTAQSLSPAALRTECETQLAREQKLGKLTSGFSQAIHAVQSLLEQALPSAAALATFDAPTRAALGAIAESLGNQGAMRPEILALVRTALSPAKQVSFRQWAKAHCGTPMHQLREELANELTNLVATKGGDGGRYRKFCVLQKLLDGQSVDLMLQKRKFRAAVRGIVEPLVAEGALPVDALMGLDEADRKTEALLARMKREKVLKAAERAHAARK
jgi:hypothetical protein